MYSNYSKYRSDGAAEHILNTFAGIADKGIALHYILQAVDERIDKAIPIITEQVKAQIMSDLSVVLMDEATPQIKELRKQIIELLTIQN